MGVMEFNGAGDDEYVERMAVGAIVPCLPGGRANESFREMEAILCGSLPIKLKMAITQMTDGASWCSSEVKTEFSSVSEAVDWIKASSRLDLYRMTQTRKSCFVESLGSLKKVVAALENRES